VSPIPIPNPSSNTIQCFPIRIASSFTAAANALLFPSHFNSLFLFAGVSFVYESECHFYSSLPSAAPTLFFLGFHLTGAENCEAHRRSSMGHGESGSQRYVRDSLHPPQSLLLPRPKPCFFFLPFAFIIPRLWLGILPPLFLHIVRIPPSHLPQFSVSFSIPHNLSCSEGVSSLL